MTSLLDRSLDSDFRRNERDKVKQFNPKAVQFQPEGGGNTSGHEKAPEDRSSGAFDVRRPDWRQAPKPIQRPPAATVTQQSRENSATSFAVGEASSDLPR